jgi:uncharacterized protein YndB with AHSA1/START domain
MPVVKRYAVAPVEKVFEVISDPTTYPDWLAGAKEIRSVDDDWPKAGSRFHHTVGLFGVLKVNDSSEVLEIEPPVRLALEVRVRPFGRGRAEFRLAPAGTHEGAERTSIVMAEEPIGPVKVFAPLLDPTIEARNRTSLNALVALLNEPHP